MRRYLLDTPVLAAFLNDRPWCVAVVSPWIINHEVATSVLAYGEVTEYLRGASNSLQRQEQLRRLLRTVYPFFLTYHIVERYADIRRQMRSPHGGGLIGDIDTLIAATALERNLTVVTTDTDFQRVPTLKVVVLPRHH